MRFPYFNLAYPKVATWEDVRERILKAIEEEKKAEATIMPTISAIGTLPSIEPIMLKAIGEEKTANADLYIK